MTVPLPDQKAFAAARRRAKEECAFWEAHRAELTRQYPDQFVALKDAEVVDHDPDLMVLARRLQENQISSHEVTISFLATRPETYLM